MLLNMADLLDSTVEDVSRGMIAVTVGSLTASILCKFIHTIVSISFKG